MCPRRAPALVATVMDGLLDLAVALMAWWTVLYWAFWAAHRSLWVAAWFWVAGAVLIIAGFVVLARRASAEVSGAGGDVDPGPGPGRRFVRPLVILALLCSIGAAVSSVSLPGGFTAMWLLLVVAILCGGSAVALRGNAGRSPGAVPHHATWQHLSMLGLAGGVAVLSTYIHLPDLDDPYYVNRSVWIAEHGTAVVRDTMFGPETFRSPYNGGIPIASIEGLIGALAHLTGLEVGTLTWVVATFLGAGMAVWALWLLARTWTPRAALTVAVVAVIFLLMSGDSRLGNFWIARMWQGKVLATAVLMPLMWVWATRTLNSDRRRPLVMLALGGVAFAGLTSTAVILAPLMSGAMIMTAALLRSRRLAIGGALFLVGPVLSGAAVVAFSGDVGGRNPALLSGAETFARVLGHDHLMVALAVLAIAAGPVLLPNRVGALFVSWVTLAALVMLIPPILRLANDATGAGPILWRVLFPIPIAFLVGLLAAPPIADRVPSRFGRLTAIGAPVVVVACVLAFGAPLWTTVDHNGPVTVSSRPSWKVDLAALQDVRDVVSTRPTGVILMPPDQMRILSMFTTKAYAVDPRDWYARTLKEPKPLNHYRLQLKTLASRGGVLPEAATVRRALGALRVTKACFLEDTSNRSRQRRALLRSAGYGDPTRVGRLTCYVPASR